MLCLAAGAANTIIHCAGVVPSRLSMPLRRIADPVSDTPIVDYTLNIRTSCRFESPVSRGRPQLRRLYIRYQSMRLSKLAKRLPQHTDTMWDAVALIGFGKATKAEELALR
jgi:hypothetical protein